MPLAGLHVTASPTLNVTQREANHLGSRYEGSVSIETGKREGFGVYIYPNPYFTYEGSWLGGKKHGKGIFRLGDGSFYEGDFVSGEMTGRGVFSYPDGGSYVGEFFEGTRHGHGLFEKRDGTRYEGTWSRGRHHGVGQLRRRNGEQYVGEFDAHKFHGQGRLSGVGRSYVGEFSQGHFHGKGTLDEENGALLYEGSFASGLREGEGSASDRGGVTYAGEWSEDKPKLFPAMWDICDTTSKVSYLPAAELLREEAAKQLEMQGAPIDPKAKKAPEKKPDKKGEPEPSVGPILELIAGMPLPKVELRLRTADGHHLENESGRHFRVSLFMERKKKPPEDAPAEGMQVVRHWQRLGDRRPTSFVDPSDADLVPLAAAVVPAAKAAPAPAKKGEKGAKEAPVPQEEPVEAEPPAIGEEFLEGSLAENGASVIGGDQEWLLPAHAKEGIYFLVLEDVTDFAFTLWQRLPTAEVPVRLKGAH